MEHWLTNDVEDGFCFSSQFQSALFRLRRDPPPEKPDNLSLVIQYADSRCSPDTDRCRPCDATAEPTPPFSQFFRK